MEKIYSVNSSSIWVLNFELLMDQIRPKLMYGIQIGKSVNVNAKRMQKLFCNACTWLGRRGYRTYW
jgi:hypothetical protein